MNSTLNNLAITATNSAMIHGVGALTDLLQSLVANGGRDNNCKFYHNNGAGGSVLQVATKSVVGGAVSALKDEAVNQFNSWLNGKKDPKPQGQQWVDAELKKQDEETKLYGQMKVDGGTIYALDDWGCKSPDALMLGIEVEKPVSVTQRFPSFGNTANIIEGGMGNPGTIYNRVTTKTLVWYDTTALITLNSDKNLISTRVTGRDYSRKELISNGDIKFSVSGQISSGKPDIYPAEEMQKFYKVMQYKGIVRINNQVLDQLGITHIVIENFSVTCKEGYKALQNYTFSAIGLQPEKDIEITNDTVEIIEQPEVETTETDQSEWMKMLNNQLDGLKSMAGDLVNQSIAVGTGLLDGLLDKIP